MKEKIVKYLASLGFDCGKDFSGSAYLSSRIGADRFFSYQVKGLRTAIYFVYLPPADLSDKLFETHQLIWNDNRTEAFIVICDNQTLLCSAKYKPLKEKPFACTLDSFEYGINSDEFPREKVKALLKESIDCGFFWDFVTKKITDNKRQIVDEDLLLNLIQLKRDLKPTEKTYILIERCLFLKFLEDKGFVEPETLLEILKNTDRKRLLATFKGINKILNGDVFSEDIFSVRDISQQTLTRLHSFFTSDYRNQINIFPYKFDVLPIELLSNIYEAFLKIEFKRSGGIYYTPSVLVELILAETLNPFLKKNSMATCIDFSCGSGIFLVKAFEKLIDKNNCHSDFEAKKTILKNCIFGVEKDEVAARITIFSLYLKLLEGEDPSVLRASIKGNKIKFPKLFEKNILRKNTLFDDLNFANEDGKTFNCFDVIVGNPPWGVNPFNDKEISGSSRMNLPEIKQESVNDFQSSQYFILKADDFMSDSSIAGIVSNNSNFLVNKGQAFRERILNDYDIMSFYELRNCNPVLFKKRKIENIEIGADEPSVVLIFRKGSKPNSKIVKYIKPSLDSLSRLLRIVNVKSSEINDVPQEQLYDGLAWRVLSVGDIDDYHLTKKLQDQRGDVGLKGFYGFQFKAKGRRTWKNTAYLDKDSVTEFILNKPKKISSQGLAIRRRGSDEYRQKKLLIKRYVGSSLRIKAAFDDMGYRFQENLLGLLFDDAYDHRILSSLYNSATISYYLYLNSAQIGKGTYDMLHATEIENVPIPVEANISQEHKALLVKLVNSVQRDDSVSKEILRQIDEIVFDVYHLKEYEKQRIRDFFNIKQRGYGRKELVNNADFNRYAERFRNVFSFILKDDKFLNAGAFCSSTVGAGITFTIVGKESTINNVVMNAVPDIGNIVRQIKKKQLTDADKTTLLKQDKIKLYSDDSITIIKSNSFIDWNETQAIKDANEEIELFVQSLPEE